jgi:hypothetical protein
MLSVGHYRQSWTVGFGSTDGGQVPADWRRRCIGSRSKDAGCGVFIACQPGFIFEVWRPRSNSASPRPHQELSRYVLSGPRIRPFVPERRTYNIEGRLPYCAATLFSCAAGALDPLGIKLLLVSTIRRHSVDRPASCGPTVCCRAQRWRGHCWCVVRSRGGLQRPYLEARISLSWVEVYSSPCSPCEAEDGPFSPRTVTRVLSEGSRQASYL